MYEMKERVRFSEVDENARLSLAALINDFQDCCTFQSEDRGFPLSYMQENKRGWFLMTWQIRIGSLPRMGDLITVKTAPVVYKGLIATRGFLLEDDKGAVLVSAMSNWVLMDLQHQKPLRIPEEMKQAYLPYMELPGEWMGRKLPTPEGLTEVFRFTVDPTFLDTNHHMNNERYVTAALQAFPEKKPLKEIRVEYRNQAREKDEVIVLRKDGHVMLKRSDDTILTILEFEFYED